LSAHPDNLATYVFYPQLCLIAASVNPTKRETAGANRRNKIVVLNRKGIERAAGKSYGTPEKEYRRLIG
jgi:hypothetical protein